MKKAFVLAAGEGTRLGSLTKDCPKPMLPLGGKPLLEHTIRWLRAFDFRELIINVHHLPEQIINYFGDGSEFGVDIRYSVEEELLGTAGALGRMRKDIAETFLTVYGDLLTNVNLTSFGDFHRRRGGAVSMIVYEVVEPTRAGIVEMNPDGLLTRFKEKPSPSEVFSTTANAGVFLMEPYVLDLIPEERYSDIGTDLIPSLLSRAAHVYCYPLREYLLDIGSPDRYLQAQTDLLKGVVFT